MKNPIEMDDLGVFPLFLVQHPKSLFWYQYHWLEFTIQLVSPNSKRLRLNFHIARIRVLVDPLLPQKTCEKETFNEIRLRF